MTSRRSATPEIVFIVAVAENGDAAVALFNSPGESVDLVLLDMTMPGMDGAETFVALHAIRPGVPIVLVSGVAKDDLAESVTALAFADVTGDGHPDRSPPTAGCHGDRAGAGQYELQCPVALPRPGSGQRLCVQDHP